VSWTRHLDDLLSGRKRGALASVSRGLLSVGAAGYALGAWLRNQAFDRGWKRIERAAIPVVSIGNLTTGGTGKTPFAASIARWYRERGVRVAFVSRGYGAHDAATNDEALVLDALCPDVPHLQNPDRVAAAQIAHVELDSQLVILDDGFQHRRLARDLDIVLIDATQPWGFGYLLPRGLLREPVSSLKRAHVVVITRVDQVDRDAVEAIRRTVEGANPQADVIEVAFPATRLVGAKGQTAALESLARRSVAAICGIGNPAAFRSSLVRSGYSVDHFRSFPDHHNYNRADVEDLDHWIRSLAVDAVLCTQKDLVKIALETLGDPPLWAVEIGTEIIIGRESLDARLAGVQPSPGRGDIV